MRPWELRREDPPLVRGEGRYVADLVDDDTLHCAFVRSPVAHGRITGIDTDDVAGASGVVGVYTAADLELTDIPGNTGRGPEAPAMVRPPLARDVVRHVGEPIVVVVATSAAEAADAAGLVWVDIDPLPAIVDADEALKDEILLFPEAGTNTVDRSSLSTGPFDDSFDVSVTIDVESQRLAPSSIETPNILVEPGGDRLHVWCGHQAPHRLKNHLSTYLGLDPGSVRVTAPEVGGAFGMKGMLFPEYLVVTELARRLGRRTAWFAGRREHIASGTHGRAQRHRMTIAGDADGRIRHARIEITAETGAYPHNGGQIPNFSKLTATGLYDIEHVEIEVTTVVTNRAPTGSYRGAGRPEAALAIERAVDAFARAAGLDPVEVRRRNLIQPGDLPYRTASGALYDSGDYPAALDLALAQVDVAGFRAEQQQRRSEGRNPIGLGVGAFIERAGGAKDSPEYARIEVDADRRLVTVRTGSTEQGQGHGTVWRRIATGVFGIDDIDVVAGDTDLVAKGVGTFASRSAQIGGSAVQRVALRVLDEARNRAAEQLEAAPPDIVYEDGIFSVAGSPGSEISLWDVVDDGLADEEMWTPGAQTFPYGVHLALVEVELETGEVRVDRIVAVDDCGTVLNEMIVEGQVVGSLAQGLGQALYEAVEYSPDGQLLTSSFMDYLVPTAVTMPPVVSDRIESPAPSNPLGAKGTGEAGCIGLPPAILNAVIDALAPHGVTELQLPLRPSKVWHAIHAT